MANKIKYNVQDFFDYRNKKISFEDLKKKYNVSTSAIRQAMYRREVFVGKNAVIIKSPYGTKVCNSKVECADELKVSLSTINRALKGIKIKMFEEMDITLSKKEYS